MELRELTKNDSGNYSVNLGLNGTAETTLNMYDNITEANITGPTGVLIAGNGSANLSCQAAAGTLISRKWLKDGQSLSPSNRITFSNDSSTVSIDPVQGSDNGHYQCRLTNPVSTDTGSYHLTVNFGPEKVAIVGSEKAEVNSKVELACNASSVPPATFSWLVNGTEKETQHSFIIENTTLTDTGDYTCVASNNVTGLTSSAVHFLTVTAPDPPPGPESSESLSGGAIAGIVIGTIAGVGLIGGGGFFAYKKLF
ncbi:carcinoembryonic antigen-related cell adhesion molecule 6-like isoform X2 [Conger conger]|nr:carcinoembryonic antigen-related cell adhesion molecule 6-like isoform X2 [Conger conger]